ncbi:uncharacterized protein IUM83_04520 [Phytophthora cinnamomi]|uniref:uncharacterized protein n=1 Tax=Phytophthora cinnamomi TaxID=4785 RepID=UPI00355A211A|nr:hypothetical protein IUM83_04520 [Phytophthora cinnamomi]
MAPANTNVECATDGQVPEVPLPPSASMTDVHAAWLAAGARGDVAAMRQLRSQFPTWLDLHRSVSPPDSMRRQAPFCSWDSFHLPTIGASALHTAAWKGYLAIVQFLLECGQDPDSGDGSGLTPAMMAILRLNLLATRCVFRDGQAVRRNLVVDCRAEVNEQLQQVLAVIGLLLRFGADPNAQSQDGKTVLHCSTSDDAYEVAKLLLNAGANVNTQDENGKMPLHYCVQEGGLLVTELLLAHGADIDAEDSDGSTPLKRVVQRADLNVLQLFFNHHQLVATPQRRDFSASVLFLAVDMEVEDVVRFVVDNDYAPVTARNAAGETPLHRAIVRHSPSVMELLADLDPEGDSLTAVTAKMETPTHYAARYGSAREVETLLLCLTRVFGDLEELVELGAANPLNVGDGDGMTSLYVAGTADDNSSEQVQVHDGPDESRGAGRAVEVRDAKVRLLLNHGGCLFPPELLVRMLSASTSRIPHLVLPVPVQYCLGIWLVESGAGAAEFEGETVVSDSSNNLLMEALTELCMQWIPCVVCPGLPATMITFVTCAGYAHEVLPLLLSLPLHRAAFRGLLRWLHKFTANNGSGHVLLLQLHDELSEAWHENEHGTDSTL